MIVFIDNLIIYMWKSIVRNYHVQRKYILSECSFLRVRFSEFHSKWEPFWKLFFRPIRNLKTSMHGVQLQFCRWVHKSIISVFTEYIIKKGTQFFIHPNYRCGFCHGPGSANVENILLVRLTWQFWQVIYIEYYYTFVLLRWRKRGKLLRRLSWNWK